MSILFHSRISCPTQLPFPVGMTLDGGLNSKVMAKIADEKISRYKADTPTHPCPYLQMGAPWDSLNKSLHPASNTSRAT